MNQVFKTIKDKNKIMIEEKSSKFFGLIFYVEKEEEVKEIISNLWKEHKGARHIVYAYRIQQDSVLKTKYSDDGEPQGTAGLPILKIIETKDLRNVLIVVVRYFGGVLLGSGLLGRTYMNAAKKVVDISDIVELKKSFKVIIEIKYKDLKLFKVLLEKYLGRVTRQDFGEKITLEIYIFKDKYTMFLDDISNAYIEHKVLLYEDSYSLF